VERATPREHQSSHPEQRSAGRAAVKGAPWARASITRRTTRLIRAGIEAIEICEELGFNIGNATKYVWRAGQKGDRVEDLRKAEWYFARAIARREVVGYQSATQSLRVLPLLDRVIDASESGSVLAAVLDCIRQNDLYGAQAIVGTAIEQAAR
jgi:Protein of unknwon function (DUF3310)